MNWTPEDGEKIKRKTERRLTFAENLYNAGHFVGLHAVNVEKSRESLAIARDGEISHMLSVSEIHTVTVT